MPWLPSLRPLSCLAAVTCLVSLSACENTIPSGARYVVAVPKAGFYKYGPAQSFGPDFMLDEDTRLTINQYALGFSKVTTANGMVGFVSNDDIKPAPPDPASPQESAMAKKRLGNVFSPKPKQNSDFHGTPGSPLFENPDLPPLPENQKPSPNFRF